MAYISLYRKWRPQTFAEVVGQEHIVQTLTNALETGRVAHAYLFSGPRGTGKTSFARLLAKGLNCEHGPTGSPCNACDNCNRITRGTSVDVIEIDGASNRGIDEIRELRDRVKYAPTEGRYKVYIIDEVHMLTNEAFNALLKVLEEPPEHVVFVFATTEAHKVPATILSRCQKFDFRRFSMTQLLQQLEKVSSREGIEVEPQALALIARHAEGGMRDALAILDQCIAATGKHLTVSGVTQVLGVVRREALAELAQHILDRNLAGGLQLIHALHDEGVETRQLLKDLSAYMRDLTLLKTAPDVPGVVTAEGVYLEKMQEQAQKAQLDQLLYVVDTLTNAESEIRWSTNPALAMELTLVKATAAAVASPNTVEINAIKALEQRVARLEEALRRGMPMAAPAGAPMGVQTGAPMGAPAGMPPRTTASGRADAGTRRDPGARPDTVPKPAQRDPVVASPPGARFEQVPEEAAQRTAPPRPKAAPGTPAESVVGTAADLELLQTIKSLWPELLATLKRERYITLEAFLRVGTPGRVQGKTLVVYFTPTHKFHQANVENPRHKTIVEQMLKRLLGMDVTLVTASGTPPVQVAAQETRGPAPGGTGDAQPDAARVNPPQPVVPQADSVGGQVLAPQDPGGGTDTPFGVPGGSAGGHAPASADTPDVSAGSTPAAPEVAGAHLENVTAHVPTSTSPGDTSKTGESLSKPGAGMEQSGAGAGHSNAPVSSAQPQATGAPQPPGDVQASDAGIPLSAPTVGGQDIRQSPCVQKALHFFGGRIVEIRQD